MRENLESYWSVLTSACRAADPGVCGALLYGSYARGEGGWVRDESGDAHPYEDFTLALVSRRGMSPANLDGLRTDVAAELGTRAVDIAVLHPRVFTQRHAALRLYEIQQSSRMLFGDGKLIEDMPFIHPSDLTLQNAEDLFFARLPAFLASPRENGFDGPYDGEPSRFFRNRMAVCAIAVLDTLLLRRRAFAPTIAERLKVFRMMYPKEEEVLLLAEWGLQEKKQPRGPQKTGQDMRELYDRVYAIFRHHMYDALGAHYGAPIRSARDIERVLRGDRSRAIARLKACLRGRSRRPRKQFTARLAQASAFDAYPFGSPRADALDRTRELLRELEPSGSFAEADWNALRRAAAALDTGL